MRALFESGDVGAADEAWAIFEASAERKGCDSNHWSHRAASPCGISRSGVSTEELVKRLEAAGLPCQRKGAAAIDACARKMVYSWSCIEIG